MPDLASGKYVSQSDAIRQWWPAAREVLLETAREYGAWITEEDLAVRIQAATGITTRQPAEEWVGAVLTRVAMDAEGRGEPRIASLCVRADLSVGDHAGAVPGTTVQSREQRAAEDRFDCYRLYGAELPEDGGRPQLTPRTSARPVTRAPRATTPRTPRTPRATKPAPAAMREVTCTSCFMVVPEAAECRECGAPISV
ncbi:hypothetical protein OVA14_03530 [Agrococcus sp. SL85]|uniref:hypothetical protein n=1 Tax=Agrococcus sp. SL85 TaxID=2995141 RepID=UPI00226CDA0C|nr:hypothetical protein [Agrococcus sp. SL85]WAC66854.1 hypothetical protein OVA14_03530 [Agrococcus sp. SL85]